jgi:putative CocE/NonD family hydrolase
MKPTAKSPAAVLWVLLALFVVRVLGQLIVVIAAPPFLPPMEEWLSGSIPYPYLLASQILIILLMIKMYRDVQRTKNFWGTPKRGLGKALVSFGMIYLTVMIIRYTIRMSLYPLGRWTGGSIPIIFHLVLASFVLTLGVFHLRNTTRPQFSRLAVGWRILLWLIIVIGVGTWSSFQLAPTILAKILNARPAQYAVRIERSVGFKTSDSTNLIADVFHPQRVEKPPIILVRIPYSKVFLNSLFGNVIGRFWAERGYTVVLQGTRGRYESSGEYEPLIHEEVDGKETLAWLKKQSWFSEKIGMWGGSYFGYTQFVLVDSDDPKISAFIIQLAATDFSKMFYTEGAFALESALQWALGSYGSVDTYPEAEKLHLASNAIPLISADERTEGTQIGFLRDWMTEPPSSEYWRKLDTTPKLSKIHGPVLSMAGWFDPFLPAQLDNYQQIQQVAPLSAAKESRLIIGPWAHARSVQLPDGFTPRNYRLESLAPSVEWFDLHLLGSAQDMSNSKVRIFVMGRNEWRNENEWPLKRAVHTSYFLERVKPNSIGVLKHKAVDDETFDKFVYDPANPLQGLGGAMIGPNAGTFKQYKNVIRLDAITYDTETLQNDMEVTGHPKLILTASTTVKNTDFSARLMDVFPDGSSFNISEGIVRKDFDSTQPTTIEIPLWPTSYVFKNGHKIRLEISSSNFPRFDRNFNSDEPNSRAVTPVKAEQTVFYRRSQLVLPVIPAE